MVIKIKNSKILIFKVLWLSGLSGVLLILFTGVQVLLRPIDIYI